MAEFNLDKESLLRAEEISERMIFDLRKVAESSKPFSERIFFDQEYKEKAGNVPINDVVSNMNRLAIEFANGYRFGGVLCLRLTEREMAPVSTMDSFISPWGVHWFHDLLEMIGPRRFWREHFESSIRQDARLVISDMSQAEEALRGALSQFLAFRFAGIKTITDWIGRRSIKLTELKSDGKKGRRKKGPSKQSSRISPEDGFRFRVSCSRPGLRIHSSPAYFVKWTVFGSPSTPVANRILPGRYIFGADGPLLPDFDQDHGIFEVPPTFHAQLTKF